LEIPAAGFELLLDTVGDVNDNGVPEIVIDELFGASGMPPGRGEMIEFYEWGPSKATFGTDSVRMIEDVCYMYQPCENGWRVEKNKLQGFYPIVINEQHATMYQDIDGASICDNFIVEHVYFWKNAKLIEQKQSVLPPTDKRIECQLSWAFQDLKRDTNKMDMATKIIAAALTNWPEEMNTMWGPASKDYFAFKLGLAYDMSGHEETALSLIQDVASNSSDPDYQFVSQLASNYLDVRSKQRKMKACNEIDLLQSESEYTNIPLYSIYTPIDKLRTIWGYGALIWLYKVDPICDESHSLELLAKSTPVSHIKSVESWFTKLGVKPTGVNIIIDSGELRVWIITLPVENLRFKESGTAFERIDSQQAWLITQSSQLFRAARVDGVDQISDETASYLSLGQDGSLVVIPINEVDSQYFFIFHVLPNGEIQTELTD